MKVKSIHSKLFSYERLLESVNEIYSYQGVPSFPDESLGLHDLPLPKAAQEAAPLHDWEGRHQEGTEESTAFIHVFFIDLRH